jgi:hypothetical protein
MFLGAYHFDGDPTALIAAYDRLMASFPPDAIVFHVCIEREEGITVFDACPTRAVFADFSVSYEFNAAVAAAGLPSPRVELLGDVHASRVRSGEAR